MKWLIILFVFINCAFAESEFKFKPDDWSKGLHLTAGTGVNAVYFSGEDHLNEVGYGLTFKTDLGYYFSNRFAFEVSSNVKFDRVDKYYIWDTLMTFGVRYRIREYFVRAFFGRAPTVVYFGDNVPEHHKDSGATRLHFNGPVAGLSVGKMYRSKKDLIWFLELANTWQKLERSDAVKMNGEVPVVVESGSANVTVTTLFFTIGVLLF